ncbi:gluconate kinase, FGGY family [Cnuella takakiae]|uniref:Gluconate kinase, FGGY family n=1 Tax=Cnuella takakiae TaxID=1302690 RepID=A0A1M4YXN6_9BACT|nr:gluconokinase [Cnuella takakiae]OLY94392.1 gluconokinase [Cnuella takakiae]SHF10553.1 gluconate kinase, FGGY family [Cnuella takakiae]
MDCIVTIEIGTGAIRVAAFDLEGVIIGSVKGSYPTFHSKPGYSEQDPEQIFITMLYMLKNFLNEKIHPKNHTVVSICFSSAMHSVLAISKTGVPLGNAIVWSDNRAKKEADDLKHSDFGKSLYQMTGTPIHAMSPLNKIAWIKNNNKEWFDAAYKFLSIKTYIIQQLTGEYVVDYSVASATGLLNIHSLQWEDLALQHAGINKSQLAEAVPVFYAPKKLKRQYQTSLGLPENVKLLVGSSDGCMATLGAGVWGDEKATVTMEESGAVRVVGKEVLQDKQQRLFNYVLSDGYYVSGGPTNNVGAAFEWYAKQFGDFKKVFDLEDCIEDLLIEAGRVPAGSEGLIFLPYLQGERAPIWNANARGAYFGLNIKHEQRHFIRATIEGILFAFYNIGKTLEEHRSFTSLSANGTYAAYPLWTQMMADMFNKPVLVKQNSGPDSVACGAFLVSATEMGLYKDLEQAAQKVKLAENFQPNAQHHEIYMKLFAIFERLSTKLFDEFEAIADLQQNT